MHKKWKKYGANYLVRLAICQLFFLIEIPNKYDRVNIRSIYLNNFWAAHLVIHRDSLTFVIEIVNNLDNKLLGTSFFKLRAFKYSD